MAEFKPHIGKNVIETLTLGMYDDSRFVYREYIQNAADQIDEATELGILSKKSDGKITIKIDSQSKSIVIEDNATGIFSTNVMKFLGDVANSQKDREHRKGFRGIGRLGGLGYCEKLVFETSAQGEPIKSIMSLDAKMLRNIILDSKVTMDASSVISVITSVKWDEEEPKKHFFKITLENVTNPALLDVKNVTEYLSMVAPVPFADNFRFTSEIKGYFKRNNHNIDEYKVAINGKSLFKAYKNTFTDEDETSNLIGVDFIEVRDGESELLALGWFGFREKSNVVLPDNNYERGIRLRKNNIGLGDESTLSRFFKAERTNLRFIGEVHAVHSSFIPNARRDYFNDNKTCQSFEAELTKIFKARDLENKLAHTASQLFNRIKDFEEYKTAKDDFDSKKGKFDSEAEEKFHLENLKMAERKAQQALVKLSKIKEASVQNKNIGKLYESYVADKELSLPNSVPPILNKYDPPSFKKLTKVQSDIVIEIFGIIDNSLSINEAKKLKRLILERFN